MRKVTAFLFMSLDGVVEAPDRFLRPALYPDLDAFLDETIGVQDAVLLGRKTFEEWAAFWPQADIEPFAGFINSVPKYVASTTLSDVGWRHARLLDRPLVEAVDALKRQPGHAIGVHGSLSVVQALLDAGALDELRLIVCPALVGHGRRLRAPDGTPLQLDLQTARTSPGGLQFMVIRPRS